MGTSHAHAVASRMGSDDSFRAAAVLPTAGGSKIEETVASPVADKTKKKGVSSRDEANKRSKLEDLVANPAACSTQKKEAVTDNDGKKDTNYAQAVPLGTADSSARAPSAAPN